MSERLAAIVRKMRIRPDDRVLEIGCGFGVSLGLICEQLTTGSYLAINRSSTSIKAASKRNAAFVQSGIAKFRIGEFETFDAGRRTFDKILAVRVRAFQVDAERSRALVQRWLAPGGMLFVEYDAPKPR